MKKPQKLVLSHLIKSLTSILFFLTCQVVSAQQGHLDFSFNWDGTAFGEGANDIVQTSTIQPNGKIIIGGYFTSYNGIAVNHIARLNSDGTLDESFKIGNGASREVLSISIQSDGKVIIAGSFTYFNGTKANRIARLNTDGTLDQTFNSGDGANSGILATAIQSDGKIIIGGAFSSYNRATMNRIARLNADGTLDSSFDIGTGADDYGFQTDYVRTISIQSDSKIIIGGDFTSYNGISVNQIARLNVDGTLDNSFNLDKVLAGNLETSIIQNDGKIIIGGLFTYGIDYSGIIRLNSDGTEDISFNGDNVIIRSISIQNDGKIIIGGSFDTYNGVAINDLARLNADGTLDETFDVGEGVTFGEIRTVSLQSDGNIIIGGSFLSYNDIDVYRVARIEGECIPLQLGVIEGTTSTCQEANETYTVENISGITYSWNLPDDWIGSSSTNSITALVGANGGTISVSVDNGCGTGDEQSLEVQVTSIDNSVDINQNIISANQIDVDYQWVDCNDAFTPIAGETSQTFEATTNGSYAVILTQGLCSNTSSCIPITITGINEISDDRISIYPNPFTDELNIQINEYQAGVKLELINGSGNIISRMTFKRNVMLPTSRYAHGIYFLKLETDGSVMFKKIIKQ